MFTVRTIDFHRTISRHHTLKRAAIRWAAEYWGTDSGTCWQVEVIDADGDRVSRNDLIDAAPALHTTPPNRR